MKLPDCSCYCLIHKIKTYWKLLPHFSCRLHFFDSINVALQFNSIQMPNLEFFLNVILNNFLGAVDLGFATGFFTQLLYWGSLLITNWKIMPLTFLIVARYFVFNFSINLLQIFGCCNLFICIGIFAYINYKYMNECFVYSFPCDVVHQCLHLRN